MLARIGSSARRYFVTGERFDAQTALRIGLVSEVAEDAGERAEAIVRDIVAGGPIATREAKKLVLERPVGDETAHIAATRRTSDEGQDGLRAFSSAGRRAGSTTRQAARAPTPSRRAASVTEEQAQADTDGGSAGGDDEGRLEVDRVGEPAEGNRRDASDPHGEADGDATRHPRLAREVELREDDRDPERPDDAESDSHERDGPDDAAQLEEHENQRRKQRLGDEQRPPQADAVGDRAEEQRAGDTGDQHERELAVPGSLTATLRHHPERHEGEQGEPGDAPESDDSGEHRHGGDVGLARCRARDLPGRSQARERRESPNEREGDHERRDRGERTAGETEPAARAA